jgi:molybdopterin synthase catalytic subunit
MISITNESIDTLNVLESVKSELAGASVLFVGSTRQFTGEKETVRLEYECYQSMAVEKIQQLIDLASTKWEITRCSVVHRIGIVAAWLVDELKIQVPIWKKELWASGETEWVHPSGTVRPIPINFDNSQEGS